MRVRAEGQTEPIGRGDPDRRQAQRGGGGAGREAAVPAGGGSAGGVESRNVGIGTAAGPERAGAGVRRAGRGDGTIPGTSAVAPDGGGCRGTGRSSPGRRTARGIPAGAAREAARGGAGTPPRGGECGDGSRPGAGDIRRIARRGRGMLPRGCRGPGRPSSGVDGPAGIRALQGRSGGFARPGAGIQWFGGRRYGTVHTEVYRATLFRQ